MNIIVKITDSELLELAKREIERQMVGVKVRNIQFEYRDGQYGDIYLDCVTAAIDTEKDISRT